MITDTPFALSCEMSSSTRRVSRTEMAEVGSSRMTSFALKNSVRAIDTDCCCPPERLRTFSWTSSTLMQRSFRNSAALEFILLLSRRNLRGTLPKRDLCTSLPRKRFSATSSSGTRARSWKSISIPMPRASWGSWNRTRAPSKKISPSEGEYAPARIFISVDFPAALSPTRPTTSPLPTNRFTRLTAQRPPKYFEMLLISSRGSMVDSSGRSAPKRLA